jgi:D-alanine-D-alanine ligase-like ATP-grasp enzyme
MKVSLIKLERNLARLRKIWANVRGRSGQTYVWNRIDEYRSMWQAAADELGAEFAPLDDDIWEITLGGKRTRICNDKLEYDNPVTLLMAGRKPLVYNLLRDNGLCVPDFSVFRLDEVDSAHEFIYRYPQGCVVKPADGTSSGQGVTTHIQSKKEFRKAAVLASIYCPEIVVEPMIPGECYRLLVLKGEVIHAVCRRGMRLTGDGVSAVAELIRAESKRRQEFGDKALDIDRDCLFTLDYQGMSLETVPAEKQQILVKSVNDPHRKQVEVRTVYDTVVTDIIGEDLKKTAVSAAKTLGCEFVGVDFITTDPERSLEESGGFINELNTTPGLHHHCGLGQDRHIGTALQVLAPLLQ